MARTLIYGLLCIALIFGIIEGYRHVHLASQYRMDKTKLEERLQKDARFNYVRVFFSPTRPSVFIFAPRDLPPSARADLENLVKAAFDPLQAPVYYKAEIPSGNTNLSPNSVK